MPRIEKKTAENTDAVYLVPQRVTRYHAGLKATLAARKGNPPYGDGLLHAAPENGCVITVSPKNWSRAVRIAHTVIVALEHRGHRILPPAEMGRGEVVEVKGHRVTFDIREALRQVRNPEDRYPTTTLEPKGLLTFRLFQHGHSAYPNTTLRETAGFKLEDRIEGICERFESTADRMEENRMWHEEWERKRQLEERREERRRSVLERRKTTEAALQNVVSRIRLVQDADAIVNHLRQSHPDSAWAERLTLWMQRAASKLRSPRRIAKDIDSHSWAILGMQPRRLSDEEE